MSEDDNSRLRKDRAQQIYRNGVSLFSSGHTKQALEMFTAAIELFEDRASFYMRCLAFIELNLFKESLKDAIKCVTLDKRITNGYILKCLCYIKLNDLSTASKCFEKVTKMDIRHPPFPEYCDEPSECAVLIMNYNDLMDVCDFRGALIQIERALEQSSRSLLLKKLRATALWRLDLTLESDRIMNSIEEKLRNIHSDEMNYRGECLYYIGEVEKAIICFQYAMLNTSINKYFSKLYKNATSITELKERGKHFFNECKYIRAYRKYTCALRIDSSNRWSNSKLYFNRSVISAKMKKIKEAMEDLDSAIKLNNRYVKAFLKRAKLHSDLEMHVECVSDYKHVVELDDCEEYRNLLQEAILKLQNSANQRTVS